VRNATRSILRAEQNSIYLNKAKVIQKSFGITSKLKLGVQTELLEMEIYVQVNGSECLAKTDEEKANVRFL